MKQVASGLASGMQASAELAANAVSQAMQTLEISVAKSVLLFLTSEFAADPQPAIRAAAKAANSTQVMGCSAPGIFTEQDWILDTPAAAALVFSGDISLQAGRKQQGELLLTLAAPNAINSTWLKTPARRFGGISGDATGQGPFSVWENAKGAVGGHCEALLRGVRGVVAASHGLQLLNSPQVVTESLGHDVISLDGAPASASLRSCLPGTEHLPFHLLMAAYADSPAAFSTGDYRLAPLVAENEGEASLTLAKQVQSGQVLAWGIRQAEAAEAGMQMTTQQLANELAAPPEFGLMFSCLGRGPYLYNGIDRDLIRLRQAFPGMPLIGFYGNGEISPLAEGSELLEYSAVLGLFAHDEHL